MATYATYRHVELDKVGCGKRRPPGGECHDIFDVGSDLSVNSAPSNPHHRILEPPGGKTSDIFTAPSTTPPSTPRKVKNYMASNIFTPADAESRSVRQRPEDNSFKKLFGNGTAVDSPDGGSPRAKNHQKSNVLFPEGKQANGTTNGTTNGHSNGNGKSPSLNGDSHENGSVSGSSSGSATPIGNGSICGDVEHTKTNGTSNGVANGSTNSSVNGLNATPTHSKRIPPGGFSTKLW